MSSYFEYTAEKATMSLTITIENDPSCFMKLETEWLELLSRAQTNTVFQTPQFLHAWWQALGVGDLKVVVLRDSAGIMQGIAPLYVEITGEGKRQLSFVGCVNVSDYLDVIVSKDTSDAVYQVLHDFLKSQNGFEEIYLCSLPESSQTRAFLKDRFPHASEQIQDVAPYILLPDNWDAYLAQLERKQRHEVKRKWRRLEQLDHEFQIITEEIAAKNALNEFIMLHQTSSAAKKEFWNEPHLVFFRELVPTMAKAGWLKLFFLKIEGRRVASMLLFDYNNEYELYNSGFDPALYKEVGTGATLTAYTIKHAIKNSKQIYDFLRGGEAYKYRLGGVKREVFDISIKNLN